MYEIKPETIKTFVTDRNIKLPRFQRKQTWDEKKNFELCISIFKRYPIGVSILSVDSVNGSTVRWLLDGRQRRNALTRLYEDPENIYYWAKKFVGFRNTDQPWDIEAKFWEKVNEYIDADDSEFLEWDEDESEEEGPGTEAAEEATTETESQAAECDLEETDTSLAGLDLLLAIVKMVHNKKAKCSGFTRPFDFGKLAERLPYYDSSTGHLSSKEVCYFINEYRTYCASRDYDFTQQESFYNYINNRYNLKDPAKFKQYLDITWNPILERVLILDKIDNLLSDSNIGLILARNLTPTDSQKIFNIINSKGEKLTAVEVLSAKPSWNIKVKSPSPQALEAVRNLYAQIGTVYSDVVRWDLAATFSNRWGSNFILKQFTNSKSDFEKKITAGFKLLAGIYEKGIKKESIERLSRNASINWNLDYERIVSDFVNMTKVIGTSSYFKYFKSWRTTIMDITSDAGAFNFALLAYQDWLRKDRPMGTDLKTRQFQKNCFILLDKLIYEYVMRQWKGSGDQKLAGNLESFAGEAEVLTPTSRTKWDELLREIFEYSKVADADISLSYMKPLLYHFYCLKNIQGPDSEYEIEIDHIIPQDCFKMSVIPRKEAVQNNLLNLGLLPKNENSSKGKKRLIELTDPWLKDQVKKYEFVDEMDYALYSDIAKQKEIFELRESLFYEAFGARRDYILNN